MGEPFSAAKDNVMHTLLTAALPLVLGMVLSATADGGVPADVMHELAPGGTLRAAINLGNSVLVQTDPATGQPKGISPELARELGRRLGVPVEFVIYDAAGKVFDAAASGAWDIAFLAIEPARAARIEFTAPYVLIEGTYMVPAGSPLRTIEQVDRPGVRIAVGLKSAYDLYLTRTIKQATIVRSTEGGGHEMIDLFVSDKLEVAAGVRQPLEAYAASHPEVRVMDGRFMEIRQAMGTPKGRTAGARYLQAFIEEMKASGFVADALKRSNQSAAVAPPAQQ
jgi:polar amino acid transport system substrate-binding protein